MTRHLAFLAIWSFLAFGFVESAWAVRPSSGTSRIRSTSVSRAPARESLTLPRTRKGTASGATEPVAVRASSAILVDANSGAVLYERSPDAPRPPASVTKILTALVILEHGQPTDTVVVSRTAAQTGGHRLGLRAGQRISLGDLVAAILIRSANDAAVAAAEHVGGSLGGFVELMNDKATELGMAASRFSNPHGLDEPFHFATARDLATLTRVALENPTFASLVRTRQARLTVWKPRRRAFVPQSRIVQNHNRLLGHLQGADGVKTGYTDSAGRCLVASASRGDQRLIAVLLNDPRRWTDAAALLEYGFGSIRDAAGTRPDDRLWHPERVEERLSRAVLARSEERP